MVEVEKALDKWLEKKLSEKGAIKQISRAIKKELKSMQKEETAKGTFEDDFVRDYLVLSKESDSVWKDLTAKDIIKVTSNQSKDLGNKLRAGQIGRALGKAGAIKQIRNGYAVYRINKIKTKKIKKSQK
tara:strand:+ start:13903 stop:14289 length:387 start_codon:yes stop_codon:yes gene_type:complete